MNRLVGNRPARVGLSFAVGAVTAALLITGCGSSAGSSEGQHPATDVAAAQRSGGDTPPGSPSGAASHGAPSEGTASEDTPSHDATSPRSPTPGAPTPGGASQGAPTGPAPGASSSSAAQASGSGSGRFGDLSRLPTMEPQQVCALVPRSVAAKALGKPVAGTPDGIKADGLGTNCLWYVNADQLTGPSVKVEFDAGALGTWRLMTELATQLDDVKSLTIGGQDARVGTAYDGTAVCFVKLGGDDDVALAVSTPTASGCQAVATAAVRNLAS